MLNRSAQWHDVHALVHSLVLVRCVGQRPLLFGGNAVRWSGSPTHDTGMLPSQVSQVLQSLRVHVGRGPCEFKDDGQSGDATHRGQYALGSAAASCT